MARIPTDWHELLVSIRNFVPAEIQRAIAPWTRGGKLDLSSPNIVGHLPPSRGGTGSTSAPPDAPFVYLVDADGAYLTDGPDGPYLIEYTTEPEPGGTSLTVEEVDGTPGGTPSTLQFPNGTVTDEGGGVYRYTPSGGGGADHAMWARRAALLDPACILGGRDGTFNYTVSGNTIYLHTGYKVRLDASGAGAMTMHTRDPREPLALPVGANLRGVASDSSAYLLDPGLAAPYIADGYARYHDRMQALEDLPLRWLALDGTDAFLPGSSTLINKLFLPSAYGIIVRHLTIQDFAWGGPVADRGGWLVTPEYGDAITTPIREGVVLNMVASLANLDHFQAGYPKTGTATDSMTVVYSLLPDDWSDIPDAPDWREDCMGSSLDTSVKWRRQGSNSAYAQIDARYQWIRMRGNTTVNANVLVGSDTFDRADTPALVFDVLPGDHGATSPRLLVGYMTAPSLLDDARFRYCFQFGDAGALLVVEQDTGGSNLVNTSVGSYNDGTPYRCRITLQATGARYEIQGGVYGAIGPDMPWDDVTPGGTQGTATPLSVGMSQSLAVDTWVGNLKVYE